WQIPQKQASFVKSSACEAAEHRDCPATTSLFFEPRIDSVGTRFLRHWWHRHTCACAPCTGKNACATKRIPLDPLGGLAIVAVLTVRANPSCVVRAREAEPSLLPRSCAARSVAAPRVQRTPPAPPARCSWFPRPSITPWRRLTFRRSPPN